MGKRKLQFFEEIKQFPNVTEFEDNPEELKRLQGNWNTDVFKNDHPIVLELACGKGDYTTALAETFPDKNFIGIDIKGDRIHRGAKRALEKKLTNVHFLRIEIQFVHEYFNEAEVDEIWITFPDPHLRGKRRDNRLTSEKYLTLYKSIIKRDGLLHLKTDSKTLFDFTVYTLNEKNYQILYLTDDLYHSEIKDLYVKEIQTYYEQKYLAIGKKITYLKFLLH